jgi:hypothetical protein
MPFLNYQGFIQFYCIMVFNQRLALNSSPTCL